MQTACPEAMLSLDRYEYYLSEMPKLEGFTAIGAGPGLGLEEHYQVQLIVESYYLHEMNLPKDIAVYLKNFADLLRKGDNPRLFLVNNTVLSQSEAKKVLEVIKQLPGAPDALSEKIRIVHAMTLRLLKLLDYSDEQATIQLYCIAARWMKLLESTKLQLFNVQKPLEYAGMHLKQHSRRVDRHTDRSIKWGREYDSYYRKYLSAGLCDQTARSKARKDFSEAHPAPVTDEELLCAYATPAIKSVGRSYVWSPPVRKQSRFLFRPTPS